LFESEQTLFNRADAVICLAGYTYNILCREYKIAPDKITTVYNGMHDSFQKRTVEKKKKLKHKYHIAPEENIILFAGRLDGIKGVDILINSFKKVLEQKPQIRLIITGDGDFGKYLKTGEYLWSKITFTGRIDRKNCCLNSTVLPILASCLRRTKVTPQSK
jgi:glycosyltransferase involved in cell wall biosynthesis